MNLVAFSALAMGIAAVGHAQAPAAPAPAASPTAASPTKVATIHIQSAIMGTSDGKKAAADLSAKFSPRKQELEKKQSDIAALQEQLKKGSATMNQDTRDKMTRDIDSGQKSLQRAGEDFEADVQQDENKLMGQLGQKMMEIIIKYCNEHGYAMVVDISNPQTPVLWAHPSVDITQEIVKLYDQAHPASSTSAPSKPATPPAATPSSPVKPTTPPAATTPSPVRPPTLPPPATKKQ